MVAMVHLHHLMHLSFVLKVGQSYGVDACHGVKV